MALFKIYRGNREELPGWNEGTQEFDKDKLHDGFAYFCADTGEFFIDVDLNGDGSGLKRVQLNALSATKLKNDETEIEIDDIVLKDDIITSTTMAYTHTIQVSDWQTNSNGTGFVATWLKSTLQCGRNHNVPPEITFTSNKEEYNKITSAEAEAGIGIYFYINEKPSGNIGIIIIDHM